MSNSPLHFTLRRTQAHFSDRRTWAFLLLVGGMIGLAGPFDTFALFPPLPRLAYWVGVSTASYAVGFVVTEWLSHRLHHWIAPVWLRLLVIGGLPGVPIALSVWGINGLVFGFEGVVDLAALLFYCPLISIAISAASMLAIVKPPAVEIQAEPSLLDRLPRPIRGRLLHIAVTDHYVEVATDRGSALVLLRLTDAIRETMPVQGLQVHRSHWVALDAVKRVTKQNNKTVLELENGTLVPVSRTFRDQVRAAGLLS